MNTLPVSEFGKNRWTEDGHNHHCKGCGEYASNVKSGARSGTSNNISTKEVMERFNRVIRQPYKVWDSFGDIPDLCAVIEDMKRREKLAIKKLKADGLDYLKYLYDCHASDEVDYGDSECYIPSHDQHYVAIRQNAFERWSRQ